MGEPQEAGRQERVARAAHELHDIAAGMTSDGQIDDAELLMFLHWMDRHGELCAKPPLRAVSEVLDGIIADRRITAKERAKLFTALAAFRDQTT